MILILDLFILLWFSIAIKMYNTYKWWTSFEMQKIIATVLQTYNFTKL